MLRVARARRKERWGATLVVSFGDSMGPSTDFSASSWNVDSCSKNDYGFFTTSGSGVMSRSSHHYSISWAGTECGRNRCSSIGGER